MNRPSLNSLLLFPALFFIPVFGWWLFFGAGKDMLMSKTVGGTTILKANQDYVLEDGGRRVSALPDSEMLSVFDQLGPAFESLDFALASPTAFAAESVTKTVTESGTAKKQKDSAQKKSVKSSYTIDRDISVETDYQESKHHELAGFSPIKQTFTLSNHAAEERIIDFSAKTVIAADTVVWDGQAYALTEVPQIFKAYEKTASIPEFAKDSGKGDVAGIEVFKNYTHTYVAASSLSFDAGGHPALYDWADALSFDPEVRGYQEQGKSIIEFIVKQVKVPAGGKVVIDPAFGLNDTSVYDIRYDGSGNISNLSNSNLALGDVNGDGASDLVVGAYSAAYNGTSGSAFVVFGGAGIAIGNRDLDVTTNYNIRYDGSDQLTLQGAIVIGDVNGDGLSDLVLGAYQASNNGSGSGSVWVMFSTLIDDVGATTGNVKPLNTGTNYNIRYDGAAASDNLTSYGAFAIGDVNGDSLSDLVLGAPSASNNGSGSGSAWVMFSTLIDDVGATTGNVKPLNTGTNYNIRYDGATASDQLALGDITGSHHAIAIGDVNGDGLSDVVLGAPQASSFTGAVYVMFSTLIDDVGATTGNNKPVSTGTNYNIRYDGDSFSGFSKDGSIAIGDVNGDAHPDLVVGTEQASNNGPSTGSVWVMFSTLIDDVGATTGNNKPVSTGTNYNIRYDGSDTGAARLSENGVIAIGDLNGDGLSDLALGSTGTDYSSGGFDGSVYVMFSTLIDDVGATTGNVKPLNTAGNFNIRFDGDAGDRLPTDGSLVIGDVNGDAHPDLVFGSTNTGSNNNGSVWVVFSTLIDDVGATTDNERPIDTSTSYSIRYDGPANGFIPGQNNVLAIGDVNGDAHPDLVLGGPNASNNGPNSGSAYVMFSTLIDDVGATTGNVQSLDTAANYSIRYDGARAVLNLGITLAVGDVNGDGKKDLVFGASSTSYNGANAGSAFVVFGGSGIATGNKPIDLASNFNIRYDGGAADDYLTTGKGIIIGDVNGDGLSDLVLGAYQASNNGSGSGSVWVMFSTLIDDVGATTGNVKPLNTGTNYNIRYDGATASDQLTYSGSWAIGDVNGDSLSDLVLGAPYATFSYGSAYVMFSTLIDDVGTTTGNNKPVSTGTNYNIRYDTTSTYITLVGTLAIGDVNGDSLSDLVLGGPNASNNGTNSGSAYVMFSTLIDDVGATTGNVKSLDTATNYNIRYDGAATNDQLTLLRGLAIGDVNSDSLPDLILSSYNASSTGGYVYVMFSTLIDDVGATTGNVKPFSTASNYSIRYAGVASGIFLAAYQAIAIGDVNSDSLSDLVLGAYGASSNGTSSGSAYVMFSTLIDDVGTTTGNQLALTTSTSYNIRYDGAGTGHGLTYSGTLTIGDIDGDAHPDLVLGAYGASNNGASSGSAYVMYSTLIDDVGATTGNIKPLNTATNYTLRYDGSQSSALLASGPAVLSDINGDSSSDLIVYGYSASYNGSSSGSVWVIFGGATMTATPDAYFRGTLNLQGPASFQ